MQNRNEILQQLAEAEYKQRRAVMWSFIPDMPDAVPFPKQLEYFKSKNTFNLVRCGNRAGKTFSTMRNLAWKVMRTHPYIDKWKLPKWDEATYISQKPKVFWCVGPSYDFVTTVMWSQYLRDFIPKWFYTDEKGKEMVSYGPAGNIDTVTFRNGDRIEFHAYTQQLLAMMGAAIDGAVIDEMPPNLKVMTEIITRTLDKSGFVDLGFTPLNPVEEVRDFLQDNPRVQTFSWSVIDNPKFYNDKEKLENALSVWKNLPINEYKSRLHGDWYYELKGGFVFEGLKPEVVDDFIVPDTWRRVRYADPASHVTGFIQFAEDPVTNIWYIIDAVEFKWETTLAKVSDILHEIEKRKPRPDYKYYDSVYDNAAGFFGAEGTKYGFRPCMLKNRDQAISLTKEILGAKKIAFFKKGGAGCLAQLFKYKFKDNGGIYKVDDHMLDCLMYFCREIPKPGAAIQENLSEREWRMNAFKNKMANTDKPKHAPMFGGGMFVPKCYKMKRSVR
jgi:phage terminase large subunit-like protein